MSNSVYKERNLLVQLIAVLGEEKGWRVEVVREDNEWGIIYITNSYGQMSWHIPLDEVKIDWPEVRGVWDGHTTSDKYEIIELMIREMAGKNEQ